MCGILTIFINRKKRNIIQILKATSSFGYLLSTYVHLQAVDLRSSDIVSVPRVKVR